MASNVIAFPTRKTNEMPPPPATDHSEPTPAVRIAHITRAVYTVAEVAELLSLSLGTTYHLIRTAEIPAKKMGGRWVVPKRRFHTWLDDLPDTEPDDITRELGRAT